MTKNRNRPHHPEGKEALEAFKKEKGLSGAEISRIISLDSKALTLLNEGFRPHAPCLARLYILTGNEAFKPKGELEIQVYQKESQEPPESLVQFLRNSTIPPDKSIKGEAEKLDTKRPSTGPPPEPTTPDLTPLNQGVADEKLQELLKLMDRLIELYKEFADDENVARRAERNNALREGMNRLYIEMVAASQRFPSEAAQARAYIQDQLEQFKGGRK